MPTFPVHKANPKKIVVSLGGSLIYPDNIDFEFIRNFRQFVKDHVAQGWQFLIITGGGQLTRDFQAGAQKILGDEVTKDDLDWLGIHTTRVNAHLMRTVFYDLAQAKIVTNPEESEIDTEADIVVCGGWKPGWSTDYVATKIAQRVGAPFVVNMTNIKQVYTDDPKKNPDAKPLEDMTWTEFRKIVGDEWVPGMNAPFDPIAAKLCQENHINALIMQGHDLENLANAMETGVFKGTLLRNE